MTTSAATTCQCPICECVPQDTSLIQLPTETREEWRDRVVSLLTDSFKDFNLMLRSDPWRQDIAGRGSGHHFCLIFDDVLDRSVLATPHSVTGLDISIAHNSLKHLEGMYDVKDLDKVVDFVSRHLTKRTNDNV